MTLIELMVVSPSSLLVHHRRWSYRRYVLHANRTDATSALLRIQVAQEKYFLQNNTYTTNVTGIPPAGLGVASPTTTASILLPSRGIQTRPTTSRPPFRRPPRHRTQTGRYVVAHLDINDQGQRNSAPSALNAGGECRWRTADPVLADRRLPGPGALLETGPPEPSPAPLLNLRPCPPLCKELCRGSGGGDNQIIGYQCLGR